MDDNSFLNFNFLFSGCIGVTACGLVPPPPPAPPVPSAFNPPTAYAGFPPQSPFQPFPALPYRPQGSPMNPAMPGAGYPQDLVAPKAKPLGKVKDEKKFVPRLPTMGRHQPGKPPFVPPPPTREPLAAGFGQMTGQFPYQQPLSYGPQGMFPPSQPAAGFAQSALPVSTFYLLNCMIISWQRKLTIEKTNLEITFVLLHLF